VEKKISISKDGLCRGHGVHTKLSSFTSHTLEKLDQNAQVDAVYIDFSKAFDKVREKMDRLGCMEATLEFFS